MLNAVSCVSIPAAAVAVIVVPEDAPVTLKAAAAALVINGFVTTASCSLAEPRYMDERQFQLAQVVPGGSREIPTNA
jgi:hypothetical protein